MRRYLLIANYIWPRIKYFVFIRCTFSSWFILFEWLTASTIKEYHKEPQTQCEKKAYGSYSSLNQAESACTSDADCAAVYDPDCDGSGTFYLCPYRSIQRGAYDCTWYKPKSGKLIYRAHVFNVLFWAKNKIECLRNFCCLLKSMFQGSSPFRLGTFVIQIITWPLQPYMKRSLNA